MSDVAARRTLSERDLRDIAIPRRPLSHHVRLIVLWGVVIGVLAYSWAPVEMFKMVNIYTDWDNITRFLADFLTPNFSEWQRYLAKMIETVQIAAWGTALAVVVGAPFAILTSSNVCPQWVVQPVRRLMDFMRAIPEIALALIFVVAVGLGPFAGVMAIFVHNIGIISKLFSEAVEAIDPRPVEGIRATGANTTQEVVFGVIPQVLPLWSSYSLYRFETNVRGAAVLGLIGAGGIGQSLYESMQSFLYGDAAAIIIIIAISVIVIDMISAQIRKMLV